jgi:hypothetical protein
MVAADTIFNIGWPPLTFIATTSAGDATYTYSTISVNSGGIFGNIVASKRLSHMLSTGFPFFYILICHLPAFLGC